MGDAFRRIAFSYLEDLLIVSLRTYFDTRSENNPRLWKIVC